MADPAISGESANPAGDGLGNLLKYAFDLDPHHADAALGLRLTTHQGAPALDFFQQLEAGDLLYALEVSPDLTHWSLRNSAGYSAGSGGRATWFDTAPPPPGSRRFLRLRVFRDTPYFTLTAAPTLLTATATHPRLGVDLLWSDRAKMETGYDLQRRPQTAPDWQPLAVLPADAMSYRDEAVAGGTTYNYRVRALLSGGASSAWSNEASATLLADSDGDGLADIDEIRIGTDPNNYSTGGSGLPDGWLYFHGLSLFDPGINETDTDADGLTNAQEYAAGTDPNKADTDGDGVPDGADAYPNDPLRSADIPVRFYGVLDLAEATGVTDPVQFVTIDDTGQVAFNTLPDYANDQSNSRVIVWKEGAVLGDYSYLTGRTFDPPPFTEEVFNQYQLPYYPLWSYHPWGVRDLEQRKITDKFYAHGLDAAGWLVGQVQRTVSGVYPGTPDLLTSP